MSNDADIASTDAILWYNVGTFGEAGFAVPNPSDDPTTVNQTIADLVSIIGRNLLAINQRDDAALRIPPSINVLRDVHKLYVRIRQIVAARAVPHHEPLFETQHVSPAAFPFRLHPTPYFKLRNPFMQRWTGAMLVLMSELMQHTENRRSSDITVTVGALVGAHMNRMYANMAAELFGKTRAEVQVEGFLLQDADFSTYNPSQFFTQTERIDTVSPQRFIFTEDQLASVANGIEATALPASVRPWPGTGNMSSSSSSSVGSSAQATPSGPVFPTEG
jgi:hypothetical protein